MYMEEASSAMYLYYAVWELLKKFVDVCIFTLLVMLYVHMIVATIFFYKNMCFKYYSFLTSYGYKNGKAVCDFVCGYVFCVDQYWENISFLDTDIQVIGVCAFHNCILLTYLNLSKTRIQNDLYYTYEFIGCIDIIEWI